MGEAIAPMADMQEMTFKVQLQPSGRTFEINADEPVLTQALRQGINMPYGCRMGTCCSCRGRIVSGDFDFGNAHPAYLPQERRNARYALLCQAKAHSDLVIEVEELPPIPEPQAFPAILKEVVDLAPDVKRMTVRLPLHMNMRFVAGQYVDLVLDDGATRSYSIANPPRPEGVIELSFHIRHMPGGQFTDQLFTGLKPRHKFNFSGPLGTFFLRESAKPAILLASGTGYAPIRSILLDSLPRSERRMILYWGGRRRADIYLGEELEGLAAEYPQFRFIPVLSDAVDEDAWAGRVGFVHRAVLEDQPDLSGFQVFACGAPAMVEAARTDFINMAGLAEADFFADSFVTVADVPARN